MGLSMKNYWHFIIRHFLQQLIVFRLVFRIFTLNMIRDISHDVYLHSIHLTTLIATRSYIIPQLLQLSNNNPLEVVACCTIVSHLLISFNIVGTYSFKDLSLLGKPSNPSEYPIGIYRMTFSLYNCTLISCGFLYTDLRTHQT